MLNAHNTYRSRHQVGPLQQNASVGAIAQKYASYLAANKIFEHSSVDGLGENLGKGGPVRSPTVADCAGLVYIWLLHVNIFLLIGIHLIFNFLSFAKEYAKMWYDEVSMYSFKYPESNSGAGHFTQMVWKNSNQLGCGIAIDSDNQVIIVCNYYPQGNWGGENSRNVFPRS